MSAKASRESDCAKSRLSASIVGYALGASVDHILDAADRSPDVCFARRVAMYLCHTAFDLSLARVGMAFGKDRSTVAYACHLIEDRRDEPQFDLWIESLEVMARRAPLQPSADA